MEISFFLEMHNFFKQEEEEVVSVDGREENEVQNIVLVTAMIGQQQLPHPHGSFVITTSGCAAVWPARDISSPVDHNCYSEEPTVTLIEMRLMCFTHVSTGTLFQNVCTSQTKVRISDPQNFQAAGLQSHREHWEFL